MKSGSSGQDSFNPASIRTPTSWPCGSSTAVRPSMPVKGAIADLHRGNIGDRIVQPWLVFERQSQSPRFELAAGCGSPCLRNHWNQATPSFFCKLELEVVY
jgi:hypothetical protein